MPVAEFPNATEVAQPPPRSLARRILVSVRRFLVVLALGALAGGGWYLAARGFGRSYRALVVEELHKHGVEASVRRAASLPAPAVVDALGKDLAAFCGRESPEDDVTIAVIRRLA